MNSDTKPTIDERIEALQRFSGLATDWRLIDSLAIIDELKAEIREKNWGRLRDALAIIDELRNDKLAESREDMAHAEVERLKAENAGLKAESADLNLYINHRWGVGMRERAEVLRKEWAETPPSDNRQMVDALAIIDELQANEKDSIMALEVCGEKIDTYIDRRKEDEKRIAELEAENTRLKDVYESAVDGRRRFRQSYREARAENAKLSKLYHELLYEVHNKMPGEDRHETARRIIHQHENRPSCTATKEEVSCDE